MHVVRIPIRFLREAVSGAVKKYCLYIMPLQTEIIDNKGQGDCFYYALYYCIKNMNRDKKDIALSTLTSDKFRENEHSESEFVTFCRDTIANKIDHVINIMLTDFSGFEKCNQYIP
jgi:hypothetical protein